MRGRPAFVNAKSMNKGGDVIKDRGMATVEASLVIPLFLFAVMAFMQLGFTVVANARVAVAFSRAVEETAADAYSYETLLGEGSEVFVKAGLYGKLQKELNRDGLIKQYVDGGAFGVYLTKACLTEEGFLEASIHYTVSIQIPMLPGIRVAFTENRVQKAYTGYIASGQEESYVYITENQSVYHVIRTCSHLQRSIYEVTEEELRKKYRRLSACSFCKDAGQQFYVTDEGDCYHTSLVCPGLKRAVYRVKKSSVPELGICSRCGG